MLTQSWLTRTAFVAALTAAGAALAASTQVPTALGAVAGLLGGLLAVALEILVRGIPTPRLAGMLTGLAGGLVVAVLLRLSLGPVFDGNGQPLAAVILTAALGFAGASLGAARLAGRGWQSFATPPSELAPAAPPDRAGAHGTAPRGLPAKIVDTSVIIDGRLVDIVAAGFVEGDVVIPQFVLRELQQVADSSDPLKRNRGRKGLDALRALQASDHVAVEFTPEDTQDLRDVDAKLLWLAERRGAKVLTNDYNLNKIAQLRGIAVLNVNDLANAVRPVVLPGEPLSLQVIKEGKERNQGVGYLDDGTMVVVENGKRVLGRKVDVLVTSVIQTNAGKMIFATAEDDETPEVRPRVLRRAPEARDPHEAPSARTAIGDS